MRHGVGGYDYVLIFRHPLWRSNPAVYLGKLNAPGLDSKPLPILCLGHLSVGEHLTQVDEQLIACTRFQKFVHTASPRVQCLAWQTEYQFSVDRNALVVEPLLQVNIGGHLDVVALDILQCLAVIRLTRQRDALLQVVCVEQRSYAENLVICVLAKAGTEFLRIPVFLLGLHDEVGNLGVPRVHAEVGVGIKHVLDAVAPHPVHLGANFVQFFELKFPAQAAFSPVAERARERTSSIRLNDCLILVPAFLRLRHHVVIQPRQIRRRILGEVALKRTLDVTKVNLSIMPARHAGNIS